MFRTPFALLALSLPPRWFLHVRTPVADQESRYSDDFDNDENYFNQYDSEDAGAASFSAHLPDGTGADPSDAIDSIDNFKLYDDDDHTP